MNSNRLAVNDVIGMLVRDIQRREVFIIRDISRQQVICRKLFATTNFHLLVT